MFRSTAIYPNRIEDKIKLEKKLRLAEEGNDFNTFYFDNFLIAKGYERICYGDHGPYIEFKKENFKCELVQAFGKQTNVLPDAKTCQYYYFWMNPLIYFKPKNWNEPNFKKLNLKIYWQIKPVSDLPNAPKREDGIKSNFNRKEGYADYKRDFYYINPYDLKIKYE